MMAPRQRAEAWWECYRDANPPRGQAEFYYTDNTQYAQIGFLAGWNAAIEASRDIHLMFCDFTYGQTTTGCHMWHEPGCKKCAAIRALATEDGKLKCPMHNVEGCACG